MSAFGRFLDPVQSRRPPTANARYNVHLPRQRLRQLLVEALEREGPGVLRWGCALESVVWRQGVFDACVARTSGGVATAIRCRVLVGADGIHSVVRRTLLPARDHLRYLGMLVVLGCSRERAGAVALH